MATNQFDVENFAEPNEALTDPFGFETPAASRARWRSKIAQQRYGFYNSNASKSHGARLGQSIADMFGSQLRTALDTSVARKEERERLIAAGETPEEARKLAKARISPMMAEERKAIELQSITAGGRSILDNLIEQGVPPQKAQAVAMIQLARQLEGAGFGNEATNMRVKAGELFQNEEKRLLDLDNAKLTNENLRSEIDKRNTELQADDDTFIKFDRETGDIDMISIATTDVNKRIEYREKGYVNIGNGSIGIDADSTRVGGKYRWSQADQQAVQGAWEMLQGLNTLRNASDLVGIFKGPWNELLVNLGQGDERFIEAMVTKDKLKTSILQLVVGTPSNYDAELYGRLVPDPTLFASKELYLARINELENQAKLTVEMTLGYYAGSGAITPVALQLAAAHFGINIAEVEPMSKEQYEQATERHNLVLQQLANEYEKVDGGRSAAKNTTEEERRQNIKSVLKTQQ